MPSRSPAPLTDSTSGLFDSSNLRVNSTALFLAKRFSSSRTEIAASADAQAIGLPPNVLPWLPGSKSCADFPIAIIAPKGKPPPKPFASVMTSGTIPSLS